MDDAEGPQVPLPVPLPVRSGAEEELDFLADLTREVNFEFGPFEEARLTGPTQPLPKHDVAPELGHDGAPFVKQYLTAVAANDEARGNVLSLEPEASSEKAGAADTSKGKKTTAENKDSDAWKRRRREQVARASKTAREKRKRELIGLRSENKRLREERVEFQKKIRLLEEKVDLFRDQASANIQLENEILRAQLEEHKKFVGGFMKLASGVPSTESQRYRIYRKGADFAVNYVLDLMRQANSEDWQVASIPQNHELCLSGVILRYKKVKEFGKKNAWRSECERLHVRVELTIPGVSVSKVVESYWKLWNDRSTQLSVYGLEDLPGHEYRRLLLDSLSSEQDSPEVEVSAAYYREPSFGNLKEKDWVFVNSRRKQKLPLSTVGYKTDELNQIECHVLARSTTEHLPAPKKENTQRITSMLVEGTTVWSKNGSDTNQVILVSFPGDVVFRKLKGPKEVITDGKVMPQFFTILQSYLQYIATVGENIKQEK